MFWTLLLLVFVIALIISSIVAFLFHKPITKILSRFLTEDLAPTWKRYVIFAIYVVGISGGVRLWEIERYITPDRDQNILVLTTDRWLIEVFKTVIGTLQSSAWMLLVFFLFALVAYVVVKGFEAKKQKQ